MAGCHVGAMEARATVTRHRLWTCVTSAWMSWQSERERAAMARRLSPHVDNVPRKGVRHLRCARQGAAAASVAGLSDPSSRVLPCVPRAISRHFRLQWS